MDASEHKHDTRWYFKLLDYKAYKVRAFHTENNFKVSMAWLC